MTSPCVRTSQLSKRYRIGQKASYGRLTESLSRALMRPLGRSSADGEDGFIWALKDVSLEVRQGEVLGIIGRNGAGKTTLLKILSRITEPTAGRAEVYGRVGSFLEVGAGFHPELTGRENVYLNGAILGMRKAEIGRKFDQIVAFAEIDAFLDTPVKYYSSGMYVRLAFAVTAFLESDILFVDEVLAVGDYRFQQKCLETMRRVGESGDTVIMVSHDLAAIRTFCTSCLWLDHGGVVAVGDPEDCVTRYIDASSKVPEFDVDVSDAERSIGYGEGFRFTRVRLCPDDPNGRFRSREPLKLKLEFSVGSPIEDLMVGFSVYSVDGTWVLQCLSTHSQPPYRALTPGRYVVDVEIPDNVLVGGRYLLDVGARSGTQGLDWVREPIEFEVAEEPRASWWLDPARAGVVRLDSRFGPPRPLECGDH